MKTLLPKDCSDIAKEYVTEAHNELNVVLDYVGKVIGPYKHLLVVTGVGILVYKYVTLGVKITKKELENQKNLKDYEERNKTHFSYKRPPAQGARARWRMVNSHLVTGEGVSARTVENGKQK